MSKEDFLTADLPAPDDPMPTFNLEEWEKQNQMRKRRI